MERKPAAIGVPGELDEQLLLPADIEAAGYVEDLQRLSTFSHP
jgi:hypothetical protein